MKWKPLKNNNLSNEVKLLQIRGLKNLTYP